MVVCPTTKLQKILQFLQKIWQFLQKFEPNWGKKVTESSKKWLFEKATEMVWKFENPSQFRENSEVERPRKWNFFSKFWLSQRGGGPDFCKNCRKSLYCFLQWFRFKNFKSPKNRISAIFAGISTPPPLWESHNSEKKIHFRGRSTSEFSLNWELFRTFTPVPRLFRKATFLNFS